MTFWKLLQKGLRDYHHEKKIEKLHDRTEQIRKEIYETSLTFDDRFTRTLKSINGQVLTDKEIERRIKNRHSDFLDAISKNGENKK